MERAVEIFAAINLLVIGFSHVLQAETWIDFFKILRVQGKAGSFANGFLSLTFGSIIVAFHWVWDGVIPTLVTCLGIAQVLKAVVAFCFPALGLYSMSQKKAEEPWSYRVGGLLFIGFGIVLLWRNVAI
jgi:hypothetical protein